MKKVALVAAVVLVSIAGAACDSDDADVVSDNISKAADNFEVNRRIVMFNGITDQYLLVVEGRCNIVDEGNQLEVTCKEGEDAFKKHFLGLSDNVSYFVEQGEPIDVSEYHYRVTFKPQAILPDPDFRGSSPIELADLVAHMPRDRRSWHGCSSGRSSGNAGSWRSTRLLPFRS